MLTALSNAYDINVYFGSLTTFAKKTNSYYQSYWLASSQPVALPK